MVLSNVFAGNCARFCSSEVRLRVNPEINAVSTIFIAFVASIVLAASLLSKFYGAGREPAAQVVVKI